MQTNYEYWKDLADRQSVTEKQAFSMLRSYLAGVNMSKPDPDLDKTVAEATIKFEDMLKGMSSSITGDVLTALTDTARVEYQREGDYIDDPVAGYAEGAGYASDGQAFKGQKVEINLALDASISMAKADGLDKDWHEYNKFTVNQYGKDNPLTVAPRLFSASLLMRHLYNSLSETTKQLASDSFKIRAYTYALGSRGNVVEPYTGGVWISHHDMGYGTPIQPLLNAIREDEVATGESGAIKLDLIITDGELTYEDAPANEKQMDRFMGGGTVQTIVVDIKQRYNFTPKPYPNFFFHLNAHSPQVMAGVFQQVMSDTFQNM